MFRTSTLRSAFLSTVLACVVLAGVGGASTQTAWALSAAELAQAQANFKAANPNGTTLTPAQFKTFIDLNAESSIGRAARIKSNNAYSRAFAAVDANKDGAVTWDEYVKAQ
jgi:hypothetical protein